MDRLKLFNRYILFVGSEREKDSFGTIVEVKKFLRERNPSSFYIYKNFSLEDLWSKEYEDEETFFLKDAEQS